MVMAAVLYAAFFVVLANAASMPRRPAGPAATIPPSLCGLQPPEAAHGHQACGYVRLRRVRRHRRPDAAQAAARALLPVPRRQFADECRIIGAARSELGRRRLPRPGCEGAAASTSPRTTRTRRRSTASSACCTTRAATPPPRAGWKRSQRCSASSPTACASSTWPPRPTSTARPARTCSAAGLVTRTARASCWRSRSATTSNPPAQINDVVGQVFGEAQTFRIDHYLGKETVQNLLALRFANVVFERLWNADVIDHVQITVGETVGVESARRLLRPLRRAARHGAEPPAAAALPAGDGAAEQPRAPTRCATRS